MPRSENRSAESENPSATFTWSARVLPSPGQNATVYSRNHSFVIHKQASFDTSDAHLSAVEHFLGALAADLVIGFTNHAARQGIEVDEVEASLSAVLANPLVHIGVIGETGETALTRIYGAVYAYSASAAPDVQAVWQETLHRSPLYNTLKHSVALDIALRLVL